MIIHFKLLQDNVWNSKTTELDTRNSNFMRYEHPEVVKGPRKAENATAMSLHAPTFLPSQLPAYLRHMHTS